METSCRSTRGAVDVVVHSVLAMATGDLADFEPLYRPDAIDRENVVQPPASRVPGPAGFFATATWLRDAFAGLRYDIHHAIAGGDLVAVNSTMHGRHIRPFRALHRGWSG